MRTIGISSFNKIGMPTINFHLCRRKTEKSPFKSTCGFVSKADNVLDRMGTFGAPNWPLPHGPGPLHVHPAGILLQKLESSFHAHVLLRWNLNLTWYFFFAVYCKDPGPGTTRCWPWPQWAPALQGSAVHRAWLKAFAKVKNKLAAIMNSSPRPSPHYSCPSHWYF